MSTSFVSIGRDTVKIALFDTKGGSVTLYKSLTGDDQSKLASKYEGMENVAAKFDQAIDTILACFVEWNIGTDGVASSCNPETLKKFTQRDLLAMLQACTGRPLLDDKGNLLSEEESRKKAVSA